MLLLYSNEMVTFAVIKPQYFNRFTEPLLNWLGFLKAPRLEDRSTGGVKAIAEQVRRLAQGRPTILLISPKGTIQNKPWRSGYKHIAEELGWPIRCMLVDYSLRTVSFSGPMKPIDEDLQEVLGLAVPFVLERSEIKIYGPYDPFELMFIFDSLVLSNLSMVPVIFKLLFIQYYGLAILSIAVMGVSMAYHNERESKFSFLDEILSKILILCGLWSFEKHVTIKFLAFFALGMMFYWAGTPRNSEKFRGHYIVFHSIFHVLMSLSAWLLVPGQLK